MLLIAGCASTGLATPPAREEVMTGWQEFVLPGKRGTHYRAAWEGTRPVVHARAEASASMLRRRLRVEREALGTIEFSWRVTTLVRGADLTDVDASDSAVRVVLAFDGDRGRLSARNRMLFDLAEAVSGEAPPFATLMYVWDNKLAPETVIHSGRSDRVRKIVLESGPERRDRWLHYRRDVVADFRRAFGEDPGALTGVALMTDADNTRASAEAWYGEVTLRRPDGRPH